MFLTSILINRTSLLSSRKFINPFLVSHLWWVSQYRSSIKCPRNRKILTKIWTAMMRRPPRKNWSLKWSKKRQMRWQLVNSQESLTKIKSPAFNQKITTIIMSDLLTNRSYRIWWMTLMMSTPMITTAVDTSNNKTRRQVVEFSARFTMLGQKWSVGWVTGWAVVKLVVHSKRIKLISPM